MFVCSSFWNYVVFSAQIFDILFKIWVHHIAWDKVLAHNEVFRCPGTWSNSPLVSENCLRKRMKFHAGKVRILPIRIPLRRRYQQRIGPYYLGVCWSPVNGISLQSIVQPSMANIVDGATLSVVDQGAQ